MPDTTPSSGSKHLPIIVVIGGMLYALSGTQGTVVKVDDPPAAVEAVVAGESTPVLPRLVPVPDPISVAETPPESAPEPTTPQEPVDNSPGTFVKKIVDGVEYTSRREWNGKKYVWSEYRVEAQSETPAKPVTAPTNVPANQKINVTIWGPENCIPCNNAVAEGNASAKFKFTKRSDIPQEVQNYAAQVGSYPIVEFVTPKGRGLLQWTGLAAFEAEYTRMWKAGGAGPKKPAFLKNCTR